jgi:hypothetical protein
MPQWACGCRREQFLSVQNFSLAVPLFWCSHAVLVDSHPFCTMLDLQLSLYCPLCYNSRAHCSLLPCLCTTGAILAGAHSYFVVSSFKCEEKDSWHDLIPNPHMKEVLQSVFWHLPPCCKSIQAPFFSAKTWWISIKHAWTRQHWTFTCMCEFFPTCQ